MGSESRVRNHFEAVGRASRDLFLLKVSRKLNDTGLRYRVTNMSTIAYKRVVGAHFKSAVGGVRESSS